MAYENVLQQWREGERRYLALSPEQALTVERIVAAVVAELRRRLGGRFYSAELAELYDGGTTWCLELATHIAPDDPWAWDSRLTADAAFARYLRDAADYKGARRDSV